MALTRTLFNYALIPFGAWVIFVVLQKLKRSFEVRRLAAAQGCGPVVSWKYLDPVLGLDYLWLVYKNFSAHEFLQGTANRYLKMKSNTVYYSTLIGTPMISTIEPANLRCVLSAKTKDYHLDTQRKEAMKSIIGEGIFSSDGPFWAHSRELLKPTFARANIDDPTFLETHANDLMEAILTESGEKNEKIIDLQVLFSCASLDVITDFLFGASARSLDPAKRGDGSKTDAEKFFDAFRYIVNSLDSSSSKYGMLALLLPDVVYRKSKKVMDSYVDSIIDKAIADEKSSRFITPDSPQRHTLLADIVKETQDRPRLRAEFLNVLLAGRDTTESFLSGIFFTLSQRPDIYNKLQKEIDDADIPLEPSLSQLKSLPYLRAILNEAQRLYPSAPENDRTAIADTVLPVGGGPDQKSPVFVKKGSTIHWSTYALHRRKDLYGEDALEFRPERWLDGPNGEKGLRVTWEYIPFNGGPRTCIGQQFALMEVSYLTVRIVRSFEKIEAVEKRPWVEKPTIAATVLGGVKVRVTPRK